MTNPNATIFDQLRLFWASRKTILTKPLPLYDIQLTLKGYFLWSYKNWTNLLGEILLDVRFTIFTYVYNAQVLLYQIILHFCYFYCSFFDLINSNLIDDY